MQETNGGRWLLEMGSAVLRLHRFVLPLANPILLLKAADLPPAQGIHSGCIYGIIEASQVLCQPDLFISSVRKLGRTHNHIPLYSLSQP